MNTSKNIIGRKNTTEVYKSQQNFTVTQEAFKDIDKILTMSGVSPTDRIKIGNLFRKFHNEQIGKVVIRMAPHLPLKTGSSRDLAQYTPYSHTQVNDWINAFGSELFREKLKGGRT